MSLGELERAVKRTVALAGATGLVGRSILDGLLADASVQSVHVLGRRNPRVAHARIICHIVDFSTLSPLPPVDEVYLALGTTIKVTGSQAAFRAVDYDANLAVARAALAAGARAGPRTAEVQRPDSAVHAARAHPAPQAPAGRRSADWPCPRGHLRGAGRPGREPEVALAGARGQRQRFFFTA